MSVFSERPFPASTCPAVGLSRPAGGFLVCNIFTTPAGNEETWDPPKPVSAGKSSSLAKLYIYIYDISPT